MSSVADVSRDGIKLIEIDQGQLRQHVDGVVRDAVEETLNALLDAEADALWGAKKYERSPDRTDYRAGAYTRTFHTKAGENGPRAAREAAVEKCAKKTGHYRGERWPHSITAIPSSWERTPIDFAVEAAVFNDLLEKWESMAGRTSRKRKRRFALPTLTLPARSIPSLRCRSSFSLPSRPSRTPH